MGKSGVLDMHDARRKGALTNGMSRADVRVALQTTHMLDLGGRSTWTCVVHNSSKFPDELVFAYFGRGGSYDGKLLHWYAIEARKALLDELHPVELRRHRQATEAMK